MPLVNISLEKQEQSSSAGIATYPQIGQIKRFGQVTDEFSRDTLNPTNAPVLYTSAGTGTEITALINGRLLRLTTGGTTANNNSVHTSELSFERTSFLNQERNALELRISFNNSTGTTFTQGFIGWIDASIGTITAPPTTSRHLGLTWDTGTDNNYRLSSGDGSTQTTTDTGQTIAITERTLRVVWTGSETAIITLEANDGTILASQTVTALLMAGKAFFINFFVETLTNGARVLDIAVWTVATS